MIKTLTPIASLFLLIIISLIKIEAQVLPTPAPFPVRKPENVLVIYNNNDADLNLNGISDSKDLANYYASIRNIPSKNMLGLSPTRIDYYYENEGWVLFYNEILVPLTNKLTAMGDTILYLLICDNFPNKFSKHSKGQLYTRSMDNYLSTAHYVKKYQKDSMLLASQGSPNPMYKTNPLDSFASVPFTHTNNKFGNTNYYPISRLGSKSLIRSINLIDMAIYGDKYIYADSGYYNGIGYNDSRYKVYSDLELSVYRKNVSTYNDWDLDAAYIKKLYSKFKIKAKWEPYETEIGESSAVFSDGTSASTAPNALLYGGWYNFQNYNDKWDWIPGSIASDLNSNSAQSVHGTSGCFLDRAFENGLTCGTGCISEPYVSGHSHADILMYYILNGYNFIESAFFAEPKFFWMGVVIGDPLYNPFNKNKIPVKDTVLKKPIVNLNFINSTKTEISIDCPVSIEFPEMIKTTIYYGLTTQYSDTLQSDIFINQNKFSIIGLDTNMIIHFKIKVIDPAKNTWESKDYIFKSNGKTNFVNASFNSNSNFIEGNNITFTNNSKGATNYSWYINNTFISTTNNLDIINAQLGNYTVKLIACNSSNCDTSIQQFKINSLPVNNITCKENREEKIYFYPNPCTDAITVNCIPGSLISIYSSMGQLIFRKIADKDIMTISLDDISSGTYYINIINNSISLKSQLIKK